jgi:hypothetical protein
MFGEEAFWADFNIFPWHFLELRNILENINQNVTKRPSKM